MKVETMQPGDKVEVTPADREAYLSMNTLPPSDFHNVRAGRWDRTTGMQAFARHRIEATRAQTARIADLEAENARLREALEKARPFVQDDYGQALGCNDADWAGQTKYVADTIDAALQHKESQG